MRHPVVDEEGDIGVGDEVKGLFRGGVRGHYYGWSGAVGRGGEVCVVHQGDVGKLVRACCEMELAFVSCTSWTCIEYRWLVTYKARILQALHNFCGKTVGDLEVCSAGGDLVVEGGFCSHD